MGPTIRDFLAFWWHSWEAVASSLIETLGLVGLLLAVCTACVRYSEEWRKTHSHSEALTRCRDYFRDTVATPFKAFLILFMLGLFLIGPYKLYRTLAADDASLTASRASLLDQNAALKSTLARKTHSLDTTDPVFPNFIYLLQAFRIFNHDLAGAPCLVYVTAPPDSAALASVVAQFSIATSNCGTFGPFDVNSSPDVEKMTTDGMVSGVIVLHAARDDSAANALPLANLIQVRRSYALPDFSRLVSPPPKSGTHILWLQFGNNTKWNSQLH